MFDSIEDVSQYQQEPQKDSLIKNDYNLYQKEIIPHEITSSTVSGINYYSNISSLSENKIYKKNFRNHFNEDETFLKAKREMIKNKNMENDNNKVYKKIIIKQCNK